MASFHHQICHLPIWHLLPIWPGGGLFCAARPKTDWLTLGPESQGCLSLAIIRTRVSRLILIGSCWVTCPSLDRSWSQGYRLWIGQTWVTCPLLEGRGRLDGSGKEVQIVAVEAGVESRVQLEVRGSGLGVLFLLSPLPPHRVISLSLVTSSWPSPV